MSTPTRFSAHVAEPSPGAPVNSTSQTPRLHRGLRTAAASLLIATSLAGTGEVADLGLNDGDISRSVISKLDDAGVPGANAVENLIDKLTGHAPGYTDGPWRSGSPADPGADPANDPALDPNTAPVENDPSLFAATVDTAQAPTTNYIADERGYPVDGMNGVDLSATSPGGGLGPTNHNWSSVGPYELSIPGANLAVGLVDKGVTQIDAHTRAMDLPVSFQAGVLSTTAPVSASSGTTVIAGHVNWSDGSWAPMSNLYLTRPGMAVTTSDGHGGIKHWKITGSRYVDQHELSSTFNIDDAAGPRQLLLVTCKSSVVNGQIVYDHNLVVTATPA